MAVKFDMDDVATEWIDNYIEAVDEFAEEEAHSFVHHTDNAMKEFRKHTEECINTMMLYGKNFKR